nr:NAD(+) synthase [Pseudomonas sp.]
MVSEDRLAKQKEIARALGVAEEFDAAHELERRVGFLTDYLIRSGLATYVLGISGGVDSLVAGGLAQRAVERARQQGHQAQFIAMRLPYGIQRDEDAAQASLQLIQPDLAVTVNIKAAADGMLEAVKAGDIAFRDPHHEDFQMGNIKARQRMIAQ